jgi:hypothetical protein
MILTQRITKHGQIKMSDALNGLDSSSRTAGNLAMVLFQRNVLIPVLKRRRTRVLFGTSGEVFRIARCNHQGPIAAVSSACYKGKGLLTRFV